MTWQDALIWAQGPGVSAIAGLLISFAVEFFPSYDKLAAAYKRLVFGLLCVIVPFVAHLLQEFVDPTMATEWWPVLWAALVAMGVGTLAHTRQLSTEKYLPNNQPIIGQRQAK